jgi:hypothetical protein
MNTTMKWKQLMLIVAVSAVSAIGSVLVYSKITQKNRHTQYKTVKQNSSELCRI